MSSHSDLDLTLQEVAQGSTDAFSRIVRVYALPLRSYVASQIHHMEDVDDIVQEAFLAAYRSLSTYRPGGDFGAWLRGIARNKILNHLRSNSRRNQALQRFKDAVAQVIETDLDHAAEDRTELIERLLHCISQLPDRMRRVVRAGLDGNRPAELAQELKTSVGAVYNLHYRANQLLRTCIQEEIE